MAALHPWTSFAWKRLSCTVGIPQSRRAGRLLMVCNLRSFSISSPSPARHPQQHQGQQDSSAMEVELTAPNGKKWTQPLGLFINNQFVPSSNEQKITSINPAYVGPQRLLLLHTTDPTNSAPAPKRTFAPFLPPLSTMSMRPWTPPAGRLGTPRGSPSRARSAAP